ncbi:hypothetical protein Hypma_012370 [Hypsizygus marmoreus]|uniref:Uncharacterized protein n=1 Tax=Hypsizygus marmoreus TaxID=39966 RepID=A0A369KBE2_HYPMA|nr:hypothetical protein Hypma_012370 [Hypsizygus marmoreus]
MSIQIQSLKLVHPKIDAISESVELFTSVPACWNFAGVQKVVIRLLPPVVLVPQHVVQSLARHRSCDEQTMISDIDIHL